jgi:hypothetical protein
LECSSASQVLSSEDSASGGGDDDDDDDDDGDPFSNADSAFSDDVADEDAGEFSDDKKSSLDRDFDGASSSAAGDITWKDVHTNFEATAEEKQKSRFGVGDFWEE